MTNKAKKLINLVLTHEGGYCNVTGDAGGETYCGISRVNHPKWKGWAIIDANKPLKYNQILKNESLSDAVTEFYYNTFYTKMKIEQISNDCIAGHLFCHGVNAGIANAVRVLQRAINKAYGISIKVDGIIGNVTIQYANGNKSSEVSQEFIEGRKEYYRAVVKNKPSQKKFLNGWLNRVDGTKKKCCGTRTSSLIASLFKVDGKLANLAKDLGQLWDKGSYDKLV